MSGAMRVNALAKLRDAIMILREVEWVEFDDHGEANWLCPYCLTVKHTPYKTETHDDDCKLGNLLEEFKDFGK